jgi:non-ribosomal peptide synthetase component E (peptide arylation enzyme)
MSCQQQQNLSEAYGGDWPDSPPSIWQQLQESTISHPDKLAVACLHQPANLYGVFSSSKQHLAWTYSELNSAVDRLCSSLKARGITTGSAISTFLGNGIEYVVVLWAAHKLGCPFVPLMSHVTAIHKSS